jgi:hypothetical protein
MMQKALARRGVAGAGATALALFALLSIALAQQVPDALTKKLAEFPGAERGEILPVTGDALARAFPGHQFYVLRFRQYPVTIGPPEPLQANNLFVVMPDGSVGHLRDLKALEGFSRASLAPVRTEEEAKEATKGYLRLAEEFHQDGFFQFSVPDDSLRASRTAGGGFQVTGKAVVSPQGGNLGEIAASLTFDPAGKLVRASETANIKSGIRPRCQATKLLDPDPIVRRMAEQDLLVMGRAARQYLDEQRAKASPALRNAIDHIWQRILTRNGRLGHT